MLKALLSLLKPATIADRQELLAVCADVALAELKRDTLALRREAEFQATKDKFDAEIEALEDVAKRQRLRIEKWAVAHRKDEFGERQELVIAGHALAFRKSPGKVDLREELEEKDVVEALLALEGDDAEALRELYVIVKASLNKQAILREWRRNKPGVRDAIQQVLGATVTTPESFTFTPAKTQLED